jgi:hypothetical protein
VLTNCGGGRVLSGKIPSPLWKDSQSVWEVFPPVALQLMKNAVFVGFVAFLKILLRMKFLRMRRMTVRIRQHAKRLPSIHGGFWFALFENAQKIQRNSVVALVFEVGDHRRN